MLHRISVVFLFVSVFGLLLVAANAEPKHLVANGKVFEEAIVGFGEYDCAGGQKVFDPDDPWACSPGTNVLHVRGVHTVWVYKDVEGPGAYLFQGKSKSVENWNLNLRTGMFTAWGTHETLVYNKPYPFDDAEVIGTWEGTWNATSLGLGITLNIIDRGAGGLEGLEAKEEWYNPGAADWLFTARVQGVGLK